MIVAVTGANGFVGRALIRHLTGNGHQVRAYERRSERLASPVGITSVLAPDLGLKADWQFRSGYGIDVVVHTAARVHVMQDGVADPLEEYRRVNVAGTLALARQAAQAGVKRFVFLSSIKVNGEGTKAGQSFSADDVPAPADPYGISKHEAEQLLRQIAFETGMEVVIIRPPLIYGPGVKANFESMMHWLARGVPLPLGAVRSNRRSLVSLDNLVDLLVTCIDHPAAVNETFLVSDGVDLSTADLLRRVGNAIGRPARLLPVPPVLLRAAAMLLGKGDIVQRLLGDLQLDISHTCKTLGWKPPISVDEGLRRAAKGFCE